MKRSLAIGSIVIALLLALSPVVRPAGEARSAQAQDPAPAAQEQPASPFRALDVFIDTGDAPLAAYQFDFRATGADVKLVGIEGGEHAAFAQPPYYDPRALSAAEPRVIVGAFSTADKLPKGRTRVARLMVHVQGDAPPTYHADLQVAASTDAKPIATATVSVQEGAPQ